MGRDPWSPGSSGGSTKPLSHPGCPSIHLFKLKSAFIYYSNYCFSTGDNVLDFPSMWELYLLQVTKPQSIVQKLTSDQGLRYTYEFTSSSFLFVDISPYSFFSCALFSFSFLIFRLKDVYVGAWVA